MNASGAASEPDPGVNREEEARVLHEEIDRLPEKYRTAVILCDLEGRTREEAARQLGWPIGTVGVRLMRARERLRERLIRRGLGPAGLPLFPLVPRTEPLSGSRAVQIAGAALRFATGSATIQGALSGQVTAIAIGVLRTMAIKKLTIGMTAILAWALVAAGSAALAFQAATKPSKTANPAPPTSQKASAGRTTRSRSWPTAVSSAATPRTAHRPIGGKARRSRESSTIGTRPRPTRAARACI